MFELTAEIAEPHVFIEDEHAPQGEYAGLSGDEEADGIDPDVLVSDVADALSTVSQPVAPRTRRSEEMRLGPLAIPLGVIAWSSSLLLHGGMVAAAVLIATFVGLGTPPSILFSRGDGAAEVGIRNDSTGVEQTSFAIPVMARADVVKAAKADEAPAPDAELTFEPTGGAPEPTLGDLPIEHEDAPLIGLAPSTGVPTMHGRAQPPQVAAVASSTETSAAPTNTASAEGASASPALTANVAGPIGHGGVPSNRGTPGIANGVDSRGVAVPVYPLESQRRKEQGTVVLSVELDETGRVVAINVLKDPGYPRLVKASIDAIRATTFPPATDGRDPIASIATVPFRFTLR